ncbi:hypothetical protein GCM10027521_06080 [Amycolatopsis cihanbeyliensis]
MLRVGLRDLTCPAAGDDDGRGEAERGRAEHATFLLPHGLQSLLPRPTLQRRVAGHSITPGTWWPHLCGRERPRAAPIARQSSTVEHRDLTGPARRHLREYTERRFVNPPSTLD